MDETIENIIEHALDEVKHYGTLIDIPYWKRLAVGFE